MRIHAIIESFQDYDDAVMYAEQHLREYAIEGWELRQSSGLTYINHQWRVGLEFQKEEGVKTTVDDQSLDDMIDELSDG